MAIETRSNRSVGGGSVTAKTISFTNNIERYVGRSANSEGRIAATDVIDFDIDLGEIEEPEKFANAIGYIPKDKLAETGATIVEGFACLLKGFLKVGENIVDGVVMLGGDIVVAGATVCNWCGADIDTQAVKDTVQNIVQTDFVGDKYRELIEENEWIQQNSSLDPKMAALLETAGTISGYALVNAIPGVGGSVVAAAGAAGAAAEVAFNNGANFEEASVTAIVAGAAGFASDFGLDKVGNVARGATNLGQVARLTGAGVALGAGEPIVNVTTQYLTYGRKMTDEEGNPLYDNYFDFANDQQLLLQMGIGAGIGGGSVALKGIKGYMEVRPWSSQEGITDEMVKVAESNYQQHSGDFTSRKDYYRSLADVEAASEYAHKIGIDPTTGREVWSQDVRIAKDDPGITACLTDERKIEWGKGIDAVTDSNGNARVNVGNTSVEGFEKYVLGTDPADYGNFGRPNDYNFVTLGERDAQTIIDTATSNGVGSVQQFQSDVAIPITGSDRVIITSYDVDASSVELPTGREIGSNNQRIPGGRLPNGVQEGVHPTVKIDATVAQNTHVSVIQNGSSAPVWQGTLEELKIVQRKAFAGDSGAVKIYDIIFK